MGIKGLLAVLKPLKETVCLTQFRGKRVGIDSASCCAVELALGRETDRHIKFCLKLLSIFTENQITPIFVFDGKLLPAKLETSLKRLKQREEALIKAQSCKNKSELYRFYRQAVDITPDIAHTLFEALQSRGIECMVAPFEADAQLGYLAETNYVDAVVTIDSDLLLHGCDTVIYDFGGGRGFELIRKSRVAESGIILPPERFTDELFSLVCVLAGCDYVCSLSGVGLKTAIKIVNESCDAPDVLQQAITKLKVFALDGKLKEQVPDAFEMKLRSALIALKYQWIYDPLHKTIKRKSLPSLPLAESVLDAAVGTVENPVRLVDICQGKLHPKTEQPFAKSTERKRPSPDKENEPPPKRSKRQRTVPQTDKVTTMLKYQNHLQPPRKPDTKPIQTIEYLAAGPSSPNRGVKRGKAWRKGDASIISSFAYTA